MKKTIIIDDETVIEENEHYNKPRRQKRPRILKKIANVTPLVSLFIFLLVGFTLDAWHPGWLIFFLVPITGILSKD